MSEDIRAEVGETRIEGTQRDYWNSKTGGYAKVNDQVRGVLLRAEVDEYKGKPTTQYVIKAVDGHEIYLPGHAVLNGLMLKVQVGRTVRIVYLGKGEGRRGRNAPELYDVFLTADLMQEVPKVKEEKKETADVAGIKDLMGKLAFASKIYPDGIPEQIVIDSVKAQCRELGYKDATAPDAMLQHLKERGYIYQPKTGFYKVTV